jgi:predicted Zn-dependent peptidase
MEYQLFTLKNGIKVIHQQVDSPVAHFGLIVNTGSRDELPHEQGMAHFIEHTIFKGTQKRKAFQIINRIEDVGGELNAYTTKEETAIYATFLCEYYERTIELISDILINASFPEKELEKEKDVIIEEINSYNDSPSELIFDDFEELIFDGHPIARNILGTPETVKSFDRNSIQAFISRNYDPSQMVITSVGRIDSQQFQQLIEHHFEPTTGIGSIQNRVPFTGYSPQKRKVHKETFQSHCIVGIESYNLNDPRRLPMVLLNNVLGGNSMNSRLNMLLRERNGLAYNVESNYTPYTDTGIFMVYFGTDPQNTKRALELIYKEFELMRSNPMGPQQLAKAKKQLIGQLAIANENHDELMLTNGRSLLYFEKVDRWADVFAKIERISIDDIATVANEMLDTKRMSKLIYS